MMSYLYSGDDVMDCFAKFETFLPHNIIIPIVMTVGGQMTETGGTFYPPYILGCQNTPYILGFSQYRQFLQFLGTRFHLSFISPKIANYK